MQSAAQQYDLHSPELIHPTINLSQPAAQYAFPSVKILQILQILPHRGSLRSQLQRGHFADLANIERRLSSLSSSSSGFYVGLLLIKLRRKKRKIIANFSQVYQYGSLLAAAARVCRRQCYGKHWRQSAMGALWVWEGRHRKYQYRTKILMCQ